MSDLINRIDDAIDLVCRLSSGEEKWTMRVPVDENRDTDVVLVGILTDCKTAIINKFCPHCGQPVEDKT